MTRHQVQVNFDEIKRQTARMEEAYALILQGEKIHNDFQDSLNAVWQGENSDRAKAISNALGDHMAGQRAVFRELIDSTNRQAKNWYDAEMEAIRIAEERAAREAAERAAREAEERAKNRPNPGNIR